MSASFPDPVRSTSAGAVARAILLVTCVALAVASGTADEQSLQLAALAVVLLAGACLALPARSRAVLLVGPLEAGTWAAAVVATGGAQSAALPYLVGPAFAAGLTLGVQGAVLVPAVAAFCVVVGTTQVDSLSASEITRAASEWVALGLAIGLLAAWVRRLQEEATPTDAYVSAHSLLDQLRVVARRLSVGLDAPALAERLLNDAQSAAGPSRGAVLVRAADDRLAPLATSGVEKLTWPTSLHGEGPLQDVWLGQQPYVGQLPLTSRTGGVSIVLPLIVAHRTIGLLALDLMSAERPSPEVLADLRDIAATAAMRLETALLFEEVREVATVEERRRLARELHDGIAQELAAIGYGLDGLSAVARKASPEMLPDLADMRASLTRTIAELRSSMFDLRNEVDQHGGLGAALSEYVRGVGSKSALTVHLTLDESAGRLPPDQEAELFRIAQEAITNVRKHAGAENLWVRCLIAPPHAELHVEDDGSGLYRASADGHGLSIMAERAARLRAEFLMEPRDPRGTAIHCVLGGSTVLAGAGEASRGAVADQGAPGR